MTPAKSTTGRTPKRSRDNVWTDEERAAMQESARERKSQAKLTPEQERAAGEEEVRAKIAEMPEDDRLMAARIHQLVLESVPDLVPRTYYGMPAYAIRGKTICFFQSKAKFRVRYSTFGFQPDAKIDDGEFWPVAYALTKLTPAVEKQIAALVKRAVG
jgi:uncharacterized protein YdhG (YjbR/CyaY superfamily)